MAERRVARPASCPSVEPEDFESGVATPRITSNCDTSIMPPIPQEKPETTACSTRAMCLPSRIQRTTQNAIARVTEATMQTLAAPPIP